jgi:hypothetical protein
LRCRYANVRRTSKTSALPCQWESDLLVGNQGSYVATLVDRTSRSPASVGELGPGVGSAVDTADADTGEQLGVEQAHLDAHTIRIAIADR